MELHPSLGEASNCSLSCRAPTFATEAHNNAWGEETSRRLPRRWQSGRPALRAPRPPCQLLRNHFPSPMPRPRGPRRGPESAVGAAPASPRVSAPGRDAVPAPRLPALPVPVPVGARDHAAGCRASPVLTPNLSRPGPAAPAPGTHPPPGTCWPPWPFPPPPPAAQRGPGGSRGQGSARGEAPRSGLALRGSLGRTRAAGTSAASAVAVHPGPRCRRRRYRLTPRTPRPAPVRSASSGTSSAPAGPEPGLRSPRPRRAPPDVGLCRPRGRLALPASGFASFRNTFGRAGEQGWALGSGRRARPYRSATSGRGSDPSGEPRPGARLFPLRLGPSSEGGRGVGLNSLVAGALLLRPRPERLARLCASPGYLQAPLLVICMNGLRSLTLSALPFFFTPTPLRPQRRPAAPHKRTGR